MRSTVAVLGALLLLAAPAAEASCDPSCRSGYDSCASCSAAQVLGAMGTAPGDSALQQHGCNALAELAHDRAASQSAIAAAGGVELATAAMARFPDDSTVQFYGCGALRDLAKDSPASRVAAASSA